jgi:prepilin-type N-terminal cleavage/methylation domain-containing protein
LKIRGNDQGFTLIEVLIAIAIIGITAVVLLEQRIAIVKDATRARDKRTSWVLATQKMAELELDKSLWSGLGSSNNGDFFDVDPQYSAFTWEYQIIREEIQASDPAQVKPEDAKKRELFRLTLAVRAPGVEDPIILEAEFPTTPPPTATPDPTTDPKDPSKDPQATPPAAAGGPQK